MSPSIDEAEVRRIARLARLTLADDEVLRFARQLSEILRYVEQLREVPTDGVEPLAHPLPITNVARPDEPAASIGDQAALQNAPQSHRGFFRVPAVLDAGSGA